MLSLQVLRSHIGVLWGRQQLLQSVDFPKLVPAPEAPPDRVETGTQNHEGMVGAAAAVEFLASLGEGATRRERLCKAFDLLHASGIRLTERLWEGLLAAGRPPLWTAAR